MSNNFVNDILQPINDDELLQISTILKENFPKNLRAHHFILMQLKWKRFLNKPENFQLIDNISARCKFNFFKHRNGKLRNCTFVAITTEGNPDYIDVSKAY